MTGKALLFINGVPPNNLPETKDYSLIACSDGAFNYLKDKGFALEKLDFISGDFDSHSGKDENIYQEKFIYTPDQDKTDFEKSLEIIKERGFKTIDVYGGSGGEMDHFLGNLTVAFRFKEDLKITFFDDFSTYFFSPGKLVLKNVKDQLISLYPFPTAENVTTRGLNWPLNQENLDITSKIGTRNFAKEDEVNIEFENGNLIVFLGNKGVHQF
ncbi:thiamine diphosphokinase [Chryseobacterium sp. SNU WT5]|nr:thiamine diphosphokinase [Chryseobacterium sp. SNU WT5]